METTTPTISGLLEDGFSTVEWAMLKNLLENEAGLNHCLSVINRYLPEQNDMASTPPSNVALFLMILEEYQEINRLKEKVAWLEKRLLMEISDAPPRFLPP